MMKKSMLWEIINSFNSVSKIQIIMDFSKNLLDLLCFPSYISYKLQPLKISRCFSILVIKFIIQGKLLIKVNKKFFLDIFIIMN